MFKSFVSFVSTFLFPAVLVLAALVLVLELSAVTGAHGQMSDDFDNKLHLWTAIGAGTVSIDVVVLTAALMFSFTRVSLALKFSGWMAFWHAAFTFFSTGLAVGLLFLSKFWFGSEQSGAALVLRHSVNAMIFVAAGCCIWKFFHDVVRKNAKSEDLEVGANVLERPWRTSAFQLTILSACYDALYLVKPAMYEMYGIVVSMASIALIGIEVGIVALVGGLVCFLINRRSNQQGDSSSRIRFMLRGIKAEYFCFPFFLFWNSGKALEQLLEPLTGLTVSLPVVAAASIYYSWTYWHKDFAEIQPATAARANAQQ